MATITLHPTRRSRLTTAIVGGIAAVTVTVVGTVAFVAEGRDTSAPAPSRPAAAHVGSADALERRVMMAPQPGDFGSPDAAERWINR